MIKGTELRIIVFGATGTIGLKTINVMKDLGHNLVGFTFHKNDKLAKKISKFHPKAEYFSTYGNLTSIADYTNFIKKLKPDVVINAMSGIYGISATIAAIKLCKNVAIANKESIVVGGPFLKKFAKQNKSNIIPIDSEHTALMYELKDKHDLVDKLYITCSGGPFYNKKNKEVAKVNPSKALKHPNWKMGQKISIDSATLMNKCFEMIEAYYLFDTNKIDAIIDKKSIAHAVVNYHNGYSKVLISKPSMNHCIQMALENFCSDSQTLKPMNPVDMKLDFETIKNEKKLPIEWAQKFLKNPSKLYIPIVLAAADEAAVDLYLQKKIHFGDILKIIGICLRKFKNAPTNDIEAFYQLIGDVDSFIRTSYGLDKAAMNEKI